MRLPRYTKPPGLFRLIDWPQGFQLWITLRLLFTGRIYFVQTLTGKPLLVWECSPKDSSTSVNNAAL